MARKLRIQYEGAIYHVTLRGVERRAIFRGDGDRERFLAQLSESVERFGVRLYGYCLMTNHVHLLVETPRANLSAFMHRLQTAYTVYFNRRHRRAGHLMQGRFGAKPVQGDAYLLAASRYIHLNPVCITTWSTQPPEARRNALRAYRWSSYPGYVGLAKPLAGLESEPILAMLPQAKKHRPRAYQRFVETGLAETDEEFVALMGASGWGIGDEAFQEQLARIHQQAAATGKREDVAFRRAGRVSRPEEVLAVVARTFGVDHVELMARGRGVPARPAAMRLLIQFAGLSQREVAAMLQVGTGAAVCQAIRRLAAQCQENPDLATLVQAATDRLSDMQAGKVKLNVKG